MKEECGNCRFKQVGSEPSGCLRHSPTIEDSLYGRAVWPLVRFDQWCGDFEPKREIPESKE